MRRWPLLLGSAVLACGGSVGSGSGGQRTSDPRGSGGAPSAGGAPSVDGGVTDIACPSGAPGASGVGQGLCAAPLLPTPPGSLCACWDVASAPGVGQCPPSSAAEYGTPCCLGGSCAFDFGKGCTSSPLMLPNAATPFPACTAPPSVPALVESGIIRQATANTTSVYFVEIADNVGTLVRIGKSDCARTSFAADAPPLMEAVESGLFVVTANTAGGVTLAEIPEGATAPVPVPLSSLLGGTLNVEALGSDGKSLYAVIAHQADPNDATSYRSALIEVPCCGEAPKFLASTSDTFGGDGRLVRDGGFVYWLTTTIVLDVGPLTNLVRFNLSTSGAEVVLDNVGQEFRVFDVWDGAVYLGEGARGISSLRLPGCFESPFLAGRPAEITALAQFEGTLFWAEFARGLAFSQIFSRPRSGGTPTRLVDTPNVVTWLSADATHLYWLSTLDTSEAQLVRLARP